MLNVSKLSMVYFVCHYAVIKKYLPRKIIIKMYLIENKEVTLLVKLNR